MEYGDETAHLVLLGVQPLQRRRGLGRAVVLWLEACANTAGIGLIRLEARADNPTAIAFYESLGYRVASRISGYYSGLIDAIRLEKRLWDSITERGTRVHELRDDGPRAAQPGCCRGRLV
jgi:ribosomal protein S18 acetylase RimI-like enzyme